MKAKKILIVDDDEFYRGVTEKILQGYDYETRSCNGGEEAIALLKQEFFNILITDLHMAGMDGFELIRRAKMVHPELLTVMITGFPGEQTKSKAKEEKVNGFFLKPVDWNELQVLLDTVSGLEEAQNVRKEKLAFLSGRTAFAIILSIILSGLILLGVRPAKTQPSFPLQDKSMFRMDGQEPCWNSSDLALSEAQMKALATLQNGYAAAAVPLWRELMPLKLELRHLIRDPNVRPEILLDRQKKISELQARLDNLSLSYQLKAQSILTKEQLEQLSQDCSMGMGLGSDIGVGIGRGLRKRFRY